MDEDEVMDGLNEARLSGDVERISDGKFKLTERGHAHAEDMIVEEGLPMLLALKARREIDEGRITTTVVEMVNKMIAKFPLTLQRKAKANFAPFWDEYANWSAVEYLAAWQQAQNEEATHDRPE